VLTVPLVVSAAGVAVEEGLTVALALCVLALAGAARALAEGDGSRASARRGRLGSRGTRACR